MRNMYWADIVPLGTFPTWACEPNPTLAELESMVVGAKRHLTKDERDAMDRALWRSMTPVDGEADAK